MEETYMLKYPGVKKKILSGGRGPMPHFPPGAKLVFHFQTLLDNFERTVIDDSRKGRPMEIFVGKMFKMEVWEELLMSMRIGEVAEFWCDAVHTGLYPMVSKGLRMIAEGKDPLEGQKHMCGMGNLFNYHSMGAPELDEIMRTPQPLIFIMELLAVGDLMSFKRESWMLDKDEKLKAVGPLHKEGNELVKQRRYRQAAKCYQEAVVMLRAAQSKLLPKDEEYIGLGRLVIPLVLNYCQCMLELEEYYEVIEHATELLEKHNDCVKAYYKRGKAHAAVWNDKEARRDFQMVAELDVTLAGMVRRELTQLSERMREKYWEEKEQYWNKLEKSTKEQKKEENEEQTEEQNKNKKKDNTKEEKGLIIKETEQTEEKKQGEGIEEQSTTEEHGGGLKVKQGTNKGPAFQEGKDWQQTLRDIMHLQKEGDHYMKERRHDVAAEKYQEALDYVNYLQKNQVPFKGEDWESLEAVRVPLMLNLSQCRLELHDYQQVVELTDRLLKRHKGSMRALYQRARAHSALCHQVEATRDLAKIQRRYPQFRPVVQHELKRLGEGMRAKSVQEKKTYWSSMEERCSSGSKLQAKKPSTSTSRKKKVVKWTDQAPRKEGLATLVELEPDSTPEDGSVKNQGEGKGDKAGRAFEKTEESDAAFTETKPAVSEEASAAPAGPDHTPTKLDKALRLADEGAEKANQSSTSGGDKMARGAPLSSEGPAVAAAEASESCTGIKGAGDIKHPNQISASDLAAKKSSPGATGDGGVGLDLPTSSANKVELASVAKTENNRDTGTTSTAATFNAAETDRLAVQVDMAEDKAKVGMEAKQGIKKKSSTQSTSAKLNPRGAPGKSKGAGPGNNPPPQATKHKGKKKK